MKKFCAIAVALWLCLLLCGCQKADEMPIRFYFFDVGQGDSILIRTPDGDILIDSGPESAQELLCLRLEQLGVTELALAVFTHPDEDHIGGADGVLSSFPAREIWLNGAPMEDECGRFLLQAAEDCGATVRNVSAGELYELGKVRFVILAPLGGATETGNENSIVLKMQYGTIEAIFSGDAGIEQERGIVERYGQAQLDCELYKVGHHGSNTSSDVSFLSAMSPDYAVISCGAGNSYGHPFGEVLARLEQVGAKILRTDLAGEIILETDGETLRCVSPNS